MPRVALSIAALCVIALIAHAQPVPTGFLRQVSTDTSLTGTGTPGSKLGLRSDCASTEVLVWDGDSWECGSAGQTYTAGDGLSLTGTEFAVDITGASCSAGQYVSALSSTGTGTCTAEVGDISAVTASTGLSGGGTSGAVLLAVDYTATQQRVSGTCAAGSSIRVIAQDGTVTCEADDTGITNAASANVIPKSDGTNLVASSWTDDGTTSTTTGNVTMADTKKLTIGGASPNMTLGDNWGGVDGDAYIHVDGAGGDLVIGFNGVQQARFDGDEDKFYLFQDLEVTGTALVTGLTTLSGGASLTGSLTANSTSGSEGEVLTIVDGVPKWASGGGPVVQVVSTTGTINDLALNADTTVLDFTGASATTVSGMTGGVDGRCVRIIRSGGSVLDITHEAGASTTTNRFANSGAATWRTHQNETITACYSGSTSRWHIDARRQLASLTVTGSTSLVSHVTVGSNSNANLTINAKINSHVYYTGTAPTITSCGTGATIAGNDRRGAIDVGSGNPAGCTITFAGAYTTNAPVCVVSSKIGTATVTSVSTSAVTFSATDMSGEQILYYHCDGIL